MTNRRGVLVLAFAAVVVAAGAVGGLLFFGTHPHRVAADASKTPSTTASSCALRVVDKGFSNVHGPSAQGDVPAARGEIHVGYVVENPCGLAAVDCRFAAVVLDAAGRPVPLADGVGDAATPTRVGVIAAGQRLGIASQIGNTGEYDASRAASLRVTVQVGAWRPASELPVPRTATAEDVAVTARTAEGYVGVTYLLKQGPEPVDPAGATAYVLVTDATGRIVAADESALEQGQQQSDAVWVPPGTAAPHVQVWITANAD